MKAINTFAIALAFCFFSFSSGRADDVVAFPKNPNVVDVTRPPYNARGDGVTDETQALQRAIDENVGKHRLLYFPRGTYLISSTLTWPKVFDGHTNCGFTYLSGESRDTSIIRRKDATVPDASNPQAIVWPNAPSVGSSVFSSAKW